MQLHDNLGVLESLKIIEIEKQAYQFLLALRTALHRSGSVGISEESVPACS